LLTNCRIGSSTSSLKNNKLQIDQRTCIEEFVAEEEA